MTVTTTAPVLVSDLAQRVVDIAQDINSLWAATAANAWIVSYLDLEIGSGETEFAATDVPIEVVALTGEAAVDLEFITGGRQGMIKILVADDSNITVIHDASTPKIILVGGEDFPMTSGDILVLVNRAGDPDADPVVDGSWRELLRTIF